MAKRRTAYRTYGITGWGVVSTLAVFLWLWGFPSLRLHGVREAVAQGTPATSTTVSETVMNGWRWFHVYCFRCHGIDAVGSQIAPNLRESIKALPHDEFIKVIHDGRPKKGMQAWNVLLDLSQMEDIYQYVLARSKESLKPGRPDEQ